MSKEVAVKDATRLNPLLGNHPLIEDEGLYVMISHAELDDLIGRMMMLFELNGDVEQRKALKQEFKWRARAWLDDQYWSSGYRNYEVIPEAKIVKAYTK